MSWLQLSTRLDRHKLFVNHQHSHRRVPPARSLTFAQPRSSRVRSLTFRRKVEHHPNHKENR